MGDINISSTNVVGECNYKCDLAFNYPISSCPVYHASNGLSINYDTSTVPAVTYNYIKYNANNINISSLSYCFYNGNRAPGEIVIYHTSVDSNYTLVIVIPIIESNNLTDASIFLSNIISGVSSSAPTSGNQTTINLNNFSLNAFVPKKPFYTFNYNEGFNIVAFGLESAISLSKTNLTTLASFFTNDRKLTDTIPKDQKQIKMYKNTAGPSTEAAGDIYIDCKPVNESEETTNVPTKKVYDYGFTMNDIVNNKTFLAIFVSLVIVAFLMLLRMGIKKASSFEF